MSDGIFLIDDDDRIIELVERPYVSESVLQELLARYPRVLAGSQIDHEEPREWLLVAREVAVPSEEDGTGRWSVDHLVHDPYRGSNPSHRDTVGIKLAAQRNVRLVYPFGIIPLKGGVRVSAPERLPLAAQHEIMPARSVVRDRPSPRRMLAKAERQADTRTPTPTTSGRKGLHDPCSEGQSV